MPSKDQRRRNWLAGPKAVVDSVWDSRGELLRKLLAAELVKGDSMSGITVIRRLLVVTVENPWPPTHGGRLRTARLSEALSSPLRCTRVFPVESTEPEGMGPVPATPLLVSPS